VHMSQYLGAHALEDLGGGTATIEQRAKELKAQDQWIDLDELMTYTEIGSAESRPPIAYAEAASFVQFLIETYGKDKFLQAYQTLKNSNKPEVHRQNALELATIYGRSLQQLREAWKTALEHPSMPPGTESSGPAGKTVANEETLKKLFLHPVSSGADEADNELSSRLQETTSGDAFVFYQKAVFSLPGTVDRQKIADWRRDTLEQLPLEEVEATLRQCRSTLDLLEQGCACERCDWPVSYEDEVPPELHACRDLSRLLALKAHYHMVRDEHQACAETLCTGLGLARHLARGAMLLHLAIGCGVTGIMCQEVESCIQHPDALSLETVLQALPAPLYDETHSEIYGLDETMQNRIRLLIRRANRHLIVLQYVETLRRYATQTGQWPATLEETKVDLPNDPVTGRPFEYRRLTETQAFIEGPRPDEGNARDSVQYELNMVTES